MDITKPATAHWSNYRTLLQTNSRARKGTLLEDFAKNFGAYSKIIRQMISGETQTDASFKFEREPFMLFFSKELNEGVNLVLGFKNPGPYLQIGVGFNTFDLDECHFNWYYELFIHAGIFQVRCNSITPIVYDHWLFNTAKVQSDKEFLTQSKKLEKVMTKKMVNKQYAQAFVNNFELNSISEENKNYLEPFAERIKSCLAS